ncbi:hypothetical protein [Yoonia sp. 208BN28-4]|uniref:hypothetical protein n=1 Tax=Yoonia sp. 208BN28-4 TaxID=3126505 RepID=UPI0030A6136C
MNYLQSFALIGAVTALSACSLEDLLEEPTQADLAARAFAAAVEDGKAFGQNGVDGLRIYNASQGQPLTTSQQFPTVAKVEYDGQIALGSVENNGVVGDLTLSASFNNSSTIGGGARNFVDRLNRPVGGTLTVSPSSINVNADPDTAYQISPTISGDLTQDGQVRRVSAQLLGDFLGSDAEFIAGEVSDTNFDGADDGFFIVQERN